MSSLISSVYSKSYINRNYLIKVYGISPAGEKINILVGVSGAISLIGEALFYKFLGRAERDINNDVTVCKLRRGIKFSFYRK
jgi:hypothetical protein|nr:MAG TPA: hypothetical protein [Caudoviricetes sp.]